MEAHNTLVCCGVSHKTLPLAQREAIQPSREQWATTLAALLENEGFLAGVLLVTCNRVEFYLKVQSRVQPLDAVLDALGVRAQSRPVVQSAAYVLTGDEAVQHLFGVAAGLDSMSIGESEILGQVKEAYSLACRQGTVEHVLHRLFHAAFRVGKQVRSETELGRGSRSLCGAALELMSEVAGGLKSKRIVVVGVNKVTGMFADRTHGLAEQVFVNRTHCKATALAGRYGGKAIRLQDLPQTLVTADAVFTCTGASRPILTAEDLGDVLQARTEQPPLVICDLAVPRDVEELDQADPRLVLLDQQAVHARVLQQDRYRSEQAQDAREIVEEQAAGFWLKLGNGELPQRGQALMGAARRALERELDYCSRQRSPEEMIWLEEFGRRLVDKVCSLGIAQIRAEREQGAACPGPPDKVPAP